MFVKDEKIAENRRQSAKRVRGRLAAQSIKDQRDCATRRRRTRRQWTAYSQVALPCGRQGCAGDLD